MNPWQLAKDSESSHQVALFCWIAKAQQLGFAAACNPDMYKATRTIDVANTQPIPELAWIHHIPNGGTRGSDRRSAMIAGGQLKAEGVRAGVWDIFWPLTRVITEAVDIDEYADVRIPGLYIEMKKPGLQTTKNGGLSDEQMQFGYFAESQGYTLHVCYTWLEAAEAIKKYFLQSA